MCFLTMVLLETWWKDYNLSTMRSHFDAFWRRTWWLAFGYCLKNGGYPRGNQRMAYYDKPIRSLILIDFVASPVFYVQPHNWNDDLKLVGFWRSLNHQPDLIWGNSNDVTPMKTARKAWPTKWCYLLERCKLRGSKSWNQDFTPK